MIERQFPAINQSILRIYDLANKMETRLPQYAGRGVIARHCVGPDNLHIILCSAECHQCLRRFSSVATVLLFRLNPVGDLDHAIWVWRSLKRARTHDATGRCMNYRKHTCPRVRPVNCLQTLDILGGNFGSCCYIERSNPPQCVSGFLKFQTQPFGL